MWLDLMPFALCILMSMIVYWLVVGRPMVPTTQMMATSMVLHAWGWLLLLELKPTGHNQNSMAVLQMHPWSMCELEPILGRVRLRPTS